MSFELPSLADVWSGTKSAALRYRALMPLFTLIGAQVVYTHMADAASEEDRRTALDQAAYLFGFAAFATTLTSVTECAISSTKSVIALLAGGSTVITAAVTFADPGPRMRDAGPWMIANACAAAKLLTSWTRGQEAAITTQDSETSQNSNSLSSRIIKATDNIVLTAVLPLALAEALQRSALITTNERYHDAAPFAGDAIWAATSLLSTITAVIAASAAAQSVRVRDSLRVMALLEVSGLSMLATLVGHNHSLAAWVPFVARALLMGSTGMASSVRRQVKSLGEMNNPIRPVEIGNKVLYLAAVALEEIGPSLLFAIQAMHCGADVGNTAPNRHILQWILGLRLLDSFVTAYVSHFRRTSDWIKPALLTLFLQMGCYVGALLDPTGKIPAPKGKCASEGSWDMRPALGVFSALSAFVFMRFTELHSIPQAAGDGADVSLLSPGGPSQSVAAVSTNTPVSVSGGRLEQLRGGLWDQAMVVVGQVVPGPREGAGYYSGTGSP